MPCFSSTWRKSSLAYWLPRSEWKISSFPRTALKQAHLQRVDDQAAMHVRPHRPAHHLAAEQVDHHGQEQPAFLGGDIRDVTRPRLVGRGRSEVAVQQVGRDRQIVPAVGGHHPEAPLAAGTNAVLLHQPLHPLLAYADAALHQLPPDPRPAVGAAMLRIHRADMRQQRRIAQMPATARSAGAAPGVDESRTRSPCSTRHCTQIGQKCRWRSMKAYFTSGPLQSMPSLFPGCRAPSSPAPAPPADG